ncbi:MAG: hypothetical protein ACRDRH_27910, partial [Pseudonocardia sp.]
VDLVGELAARRGMAVLHITHDLALAQHGCARLVVMRQPGGRARPYRGRARRAASRVHRGPDRSRVRPRPPGSG